MALRALLGIAERRATTSRELGSVRADGFDRVSLRIDEIPALLLRPRGPGPFPALVVHHQHGSEWHLGKSEVAGIAGDPLQAFAPALARRGLIVLCADVVSFEDRRPSARGTEPHPDDWLQHYNACAYRLIAGDLLMRAVLEDALRAVDVLSARTDVSSIGVVGHSMGGTIALWHAAIDKRIGYACVSGSAASFRRRMADGTGVSMLELIPGVAREYEVKDIVAEIAPRPLLVVSGDDDKYAADAPEVVDEARGHWPDPRAVTSVRSGHGHDLDAARFELIVDWIAQTARVPA